MGNSYLGSVDCCFYCCRRHRRRRWALDRDGRSKACRQAASIPCFNAAVASPSAAVVVQSNASGMAWRLDCRRIVPSSLLAAAADDGALRRRVQSPRHLPPPTATTAADAHTTYSAFCAHCASPSGGGGVSRRIRHQRFPSFLEIHRIPKLVLFLLLLELKWKMKYSSLQNRRRAGNKRRAWKI